MKHQMREAVKRCEAAGLVFDASHKHPRVTDPKTGKFVSFAGTPSCPHAAKNMLKDVRKYLKVDV